ncbi:unnamed protein product [Closterium sp. NIES-64]|nr:unnamed protein product [Closterium sp. NIES-64]
MAGGGSVHAVIALVALLLILAIAAATGAAPNTLGTRVSINGRAITFNSLRCVNIPPKSSRRGGSKKVQVAWTPAGAPAACSEIQLFSKPGCKGTPVESLLHGRQRARKIAKPLKSVRCIIGASTAALPLHLPPSAFLRFHSSLSISPCPLTAGAPEDICQACPAECRCDAAWEGSDSPPESIDSLGGSLDFMEDDFPAEPLPADEDICQACPAECRCNATSELDDSLLEPVDTTDDDLPPAPSPTDPDVCGNSTRNPCKYGSCISGGPGSYSCVCPPNRVPSKRNGYPTCDYGSSSPTLKVQGDNWRCEDVYPLYGLTLDEFTAQNNAVDCSTALTRGQTLNVTERDDLTSCSVFYYIQKGDTCESVSQWQHLSASPSNLCSSSTPALTAPRHSHLSAPPPLLLPIPKQGDTCESVAASLGISSLSLESLNPGVHCSSPLPPSRSLCMEREDGADDGSGEYCNTVYSVSGTSSCAQVVNDFEFSSSLELYRLNPGLVCYSSLTASLGVSQRRLSIAGLLSEELLPILLLTMQRHLSASQSQPA